MQFDGTITHVSPIQSGTSKSGKAWRRMEAVLEYEHHDQYPKAIVVSVMNDKIEELNLKLGGEYEVEVDFSVREYNGKYYQSATAWKATAKDVPTAPDPQQAQTQTQEDADELPF